jgi:flagellar FliL protein
MSDEPSDDTDALPVPGPRAPKLVVALLAVNLALSGFIVFKMLTGETLASTAHVTAAVAPEPGPPAREVVGPMAVLEPFLVNLDEPGIPRYLKLQIQVELLDGASVKVFEKNKTLVRDEVLGYLSGLKVTSTLGADNKNQIRSELERRVTELIGKDRVRRIVFADFVVQ